MQKKILILFFLLYIQSHLFSQWYQLSSSPWSGRFEDMWFINSNTGWVTDIVKIYKTENGGASWIRTDSITSQYPSLRSITAVNENIIFLGTLNSHRVLFKSTDGGFNWKEVTNLPEPRPRGICGMFTINNQYIFGCGRYNDSATFIKSTDAGDSWNTKDMSQHARGLVDCYFFNKDSGFVVGGIGSSFPFQFRSVILFTSDGGETWVNRLTGARLNEWGWKISFPDRLHGFVSLDASGYNNRHFAKTTDGGESWLEVPYVPSGEQGIGFINENTGWIGGNVRPTYRTTDGGLTWSVYNSLGQNVNRFRIFNDSLGFACGNYVYKFDKPIGISPISSTLPDKYILHQNYPNPFNPNTNIRFEIPVNDHVKLTIYDISGKEVRSILNEKVNPGVYEIIVSSNELSSGVYFYKMETGKVSITKKLVIVK